MAGVQIYTESPISPAKATALTPRTPSPYAPSLTEGTTTSNSSSPSTTSAYTPAYPSSLPTPTQSTSSLPTRTTSTPPSPQPSALPTPFVPKSRTPSPRREIPPPPKVGEKVQPPSYYSPVPTPTYFAAPQPFGFTAIPTDPRSAGLGPKQTSSTVPNTPYGNGYASSNGLLSPQSARLPYNQSASAGTSPAQTPITDGRPSFEHPPGYVQNPYAADMTPEQRFGTAHSPHSPTLGWNTSGVAKSPGLLGGLTSPVSGLGGILNGGGEEESVWNMVGGWMKGVGKKVGEVEGEVWRRINGD
ncbi:hypothetical protein MMC11_001180 [Xylographa trunciseda]|nr:hypothetical protein [Xylographa trunciseda]